MLLEGRDVFNRWRANNPEIRPDLAGADIAGNLYGLPGLVEAVVGVGSIGDLRNLNLAGADLERSNLAGVDLRGCDFSGAQPAGANLSSANLCGLAVYCKKFVSESVKFSAGLRERKSLIDQHIEL